KHIYSDNQIAVIECGGVGFKCFVTAVTLETLPPLGEEVFLFTYMHVREDVMDLFGFATMLELETFKMLLGVSGVGTKMALAILSRTTPDIFAMNIASGDVKALTVTQGVGPKLAQRMIMELKDKITDEYFAFGIDCVEASDIVSAVKPKSNTGEAVSALVALGYSQTEAASTIAKMDATLSVEELIKGALKEFGKRR
ncbi:MAG: Holliday junction branch migration protein RuvA, partial [Oscillospiraceae bacterium]